MPLPAPPIDDGVFSKSARANSARELANPGIHLAPGAEFHVLISHNSVIHHGMRQFGLLGSSVSVALVHGELKRCPATRCNGFSARPLSSTG